MERQLATIQKILALEPIKDKDRIELATVQGWHVIVGKGEHKVGDLVVYVQYDTVLPVRKEFEFLRSRAYSPRYDGFRIRNMKMAGVFSEGIVFRQDDILPKDYREGTDVTKLLNVQRYDPEQLKEMTQFIKHGKVYKFLMQYPICRKVYRIVKGKKPSGTYPFTIPKSSETNIQVIFDRLKDKKDVYYVTEKLEGQSATYYLDKRNNLLVYSHNIRRNKDSSNWWRVAEKYNLKARLIELKKQIKVKEIAIQGEICGPNIQKNIYKLQDLTLFVFNVRLPQEMQDLDLEDMESVVGSLQLQPVPIMWRRAYISPLCCD